MAVNRGKQFEDVFEKCVKKHSDVAIIRLHDQTMGYLGARNPCDFIMYKKPYMYAIECKSVHGNTLSIHSVPKPDKRGVLHGFHGNITDTQWDSLLAMSKVDGVVAGIVCWWVDKDITLFLPIATLWALDYGGVKSVSYKIKDNPEFVTFEIPGSKKRIFYDYSMDIFFHKIEKSARKR